MIGTQSFSYEMMNNFKDLQFERDGAQFFPRVALYCVEDLLVEIREFPSDQAGIRLYGNQLIRDLTSVDTRIGAIATSILGSSCKAVRAILFDKTSNNNWALNWHQDRTIAVKRRIDTPGFGSWTVKSGTPHVSPPMDILSQMVTLRIHLDDVPQSNAPLLIVPGSHRLGFISEAEIETVVQECGSITCIADRGDIWLYSTPIIHSSKKASEPHRRRVLQIDYCSAHLPNGLNWAGL